MPDGPRVGCGAVILDGDSILLMRRLTEPEAGCWGLAGGKVDPFETVPAAMRREVGEELGLVVRRETLLCVVDQIDRASNEHWVAPVYLIEAFEGSPAVQEPAKHAALGWFPLNAIPTPATIATTTAVAALLASRSAQGASSASEPNRSINSRRFPKGSLTYMRS